MTPKAKKKYKDCGPLPKIVFKILHRASNDRDMGNLWTDHDRDRQNARGKHIFPCDDRETRMKHLLGELLTELGDLALDASEARALNRRDKNRAAASLRCKRPAQPT